jgi:type II secretory pathway component PulM
VLALAACGSSKDAKTTTATTTVSTSMQAYVSAGNKVCMDSDKRIFKLGRLTRNPKGWAKTAAAARVAIAEMVKVKPPPERAAAFRQMLRFANALALSVQEVHDALVKSDLDTATAAQFAAAQIQDNVHTSAKAAGLTFCQQQLTNWPA